MKHEIRKKAGFKIMGMKYYGNNSKGEIKDLWDQFDQRIHEIGNRINKETAYGYDTWTKEINENGCFTYIAGVEVEDDSNIPEDMVYVEVPSSKYAVFEITISDMIDGVIKEIYGKWLPKYGLTVSKNYDFELNESENKNLGDTLLFHIPIK